MSSVAVQPEAVVRVGMPTPWGAAQHVTILAEGIGFVSTASHGGVRLSPARQELIPAVARSADGWYEEDCACSIPLTVFKLEIIAHGDRGLVEHPPEETWKRWYPDSYEAVFGVVLAPGESRAKDERAFMAEHAGDYLVCSAFGSWHERVAEGFVGVCATRGGNRRGAERWFMLPAEEYHKRGPFGFVIDLARHVEVPPLC